MVSDAEQRLAENVTEAKKGKNSKGFQQVPTLQRSQVRRMKNQIHLMSTNWISGHSLPSPQSEVFLFPLYTTKYGQEFIVFVQGHTANERQNQNLNSNLYDSKAPAGIKITANTITFSELQIQ